jgi:hypothetical protein
VSQKQLHRIKFGQDRGLEYFYLFSAGSFTFPNLGWMAGMPAKLEIIQNGKNGNATGVGHTPLTSGILPV